ncbi:hypothetical protein FQR65_LT07078 [Abscondita terminalis]|nr:hypothetical protein FQR65_LT07078 [Abscondita terminalis]
MEESVKKLKKHKKEEEIKNYNYDEFATVQSDNTKNCSSKHLLNKTSQEEGIGLSLEVEIADSLKQLITSPEKHNSSLLDVTIVRPTDLNCVRGIETNFTNLNSSEIRNLIASMERQKQQKKKLIDEYKKHAMEAQAKHKRRTEKKSHRKNIEVVSAHAKTTKNTDLKQLYTNSAPISVLKPLMGQIKQSLKNLEDRIVEVGDHRPKDIKVIASKIKLPVHTSSNDSNLSQETAKRRRAKRRLRKLRDCVRPRNHHVYATVNTFDKLRTMLKCQNPNGQDPESDKPCLCQHCGMIGLLMDSQKRPIMPSLPVKTSEGADNQDAESTDTSNMDEQYYIIREIARRLKNLEDRVTIQEQCAVPKDYFKKVIKKILNIQGSISQQNVGGVGTFGAARHCGTQYGFDFPDDLEKKSKSRVKQRNVQIQQGYGKKYMINPLEVDVMDTTSETNPQSVETNVGNKAISAITDFFSKLGHDKKEENKAYAIDAFWKWGEEIIRPGVDLKMKILCLLDEKIQSSSKGSDFKPKRNKRKISLLSLTETTHPLFNSSSCTMKRMIDLMSEKIYHDHVKPTVDAIKEEQKNLQKENNENMYIMKNEMEAAILKINTNQSNACEVKDDYLECVIKPEEEFSCVKTSKAIKSGIPIRIGKTSVIDSVSVNPKSNEIRNSFIPKLKPNKKVSASTIFDKMLNECKRHVEGDRNKNGQTSGKAVNVAYMNPKVSMWNEDSLASVPVLTADEIHSIRLSSTSSSQCKIDNIDEENDNNISDEKPRRIFKNHSIAEKLEFLKSIASTEIVKSQLWTNIWNQAKTYCKSKDDTVIIQIPTKLQNKHVGITEVEFTIEDIQQLMNSTDRLNTIEDTPTNSKNPGNIDSFLLIRSRKILEDVHKRLGSKFLRQ